MPAFVNAACARRGSSTIRLITPKVSDVEMVVARILIFSPARTEVTAASLPGLFSAKIDN